MYHSTRRTTHSFFIHSFSFPALDLINQRRGTSKLPSHPIAPTVMPKTPETKKPPGKENSIMDAVSALTSLGDEEDSNTEESGGDSNPPPAKKPKLEDQSAEESKAIAAKRFIPDHKKPDAALTFPEKVREASLMATEYLHVESVPGSL
jgi:hypothetical protein